MPPTTTLLAIAVVLLALLLACALRFSVWQFRALRRSRLAFASLRSAYREKILRVLERSDAADARAREATKAAELAQEKADLAARAKADEQRLTTQPTMRPPPLPSFESPHWGDSDLPTELPDQRHPSRWLWPR